MRIDRTSKTRLGLSVLASGSLLLATVGAASAHAGPGSRTVGLFGGDLRSRILSMEPDLDEQEVDDLVDSVQDAIDEAAAEGDQSDQAETHDGDHADGPGLGAHEREKAIEAKPEASHKHHSADESKSGKSDAKDDENENEHEDGDAEDGEHDDGDQADGDDQDGQDGQDGGDAGGDAGGGHESSGD